MADHVCDTPLWRTKDSRWTCPDCGQRFVWTQTVRTVQGVPASVCVVYENRWEREATCDAAPADEGGA